MTTKLDLFSLRKSFEEQGIMICFNGPFSHSVIEQLGDAVKRYLHSADAPRDRIADVFAVFVEQAQNLKNYTAGLEEISGADHHNGTLVIGRENDAYFVSAGNMIRNQDVPELQQRLEGLKGLDKTELKALYKKQLREPVDHEKGGAGLGFILMARKGSQPIRYSFEKQRDGWSFFHISVVI